jgi:hypothetical protein
VRSYSPRVRLPRFIDRPGWRGWRADLGWRAWLTPGVPPAARVCASTGAWMRGGVELPPGVVNPGGHQQPPVCRVRCVCSRPSRVVMERGFQVRGSQVAWGPRVVRRSRVEKSPRGWRGSRVEKSSRVVRGSRVDKSPRGWRGSRVEKGSRVVRGSRVEKGLREWGRLSDRPTWRSGRPLGALSRRRTSGLFEAVWGQGRPTARQLLR